MKDEIKEIIDSLLYLCDLPKDVTYSLNKECIEKVRDCITNLQEENEEWSMIFDTFSKRPYAHKYLEEKKKELGNKKIIGLDSEMIYKDYYDYKSRNEKANVLLDEMLERAYIDGEYVMYDYSTSELLEVKQALQGEDKDANRNI